MSEFLRNYQNVPMSLLFVKDSHAELTFTTIDKNYVYVTATFYSERVDVWDKMSLKELFEKCDSCFITKIDPRGNKEIVGEIKLKSPDDLEPVYSAEIIPLFGCQT